MFSFWNVRMQTERLFWFSTILCEFAELLKSKLGMIFFPMTEEHFADSPFAYLLIDHVHTILAYEFGRNTFAKHPLQLQNNSLIIRI